MESTEQSKQNNMSEDSQDQLLPQEDATLLLKQVTDEDDKEWEAYEKLIGIQLKNISQNQRIFTYKLISEVIFNAKMGRRSKIPPHLFMELNIDNHKAQSEALERTRLLRRELSEDELNEECEVYIKFIGIQLKDISRDLRRFTYRLISDIITTKLDFAKTPI